VEPKTKPDTHSPHSHMTPTPTCSPRMARRHSRDDPWAGLSSHHAVRCMLEYHQHDLGRQLGQLEAVIVFLAQIALVLVFERGANGQGHRLVFGLLVATHPLELLRLLDNEENSS
jgi:hypothetical protein